MATRPQHERVLSFEEARAVVLEGAERRQVWDKIVAAYPFFTDHQAKVTREIPLVALERQAG